MLAGVGWEGPNLRVAQIGDQQFEKFIEIHSIGKHAEDKLHESHKNSSSGQ